MPRIILASSSPRRRELLSGLGLEFEVIPSSITEPPHQGEDPADYAGSLALSKAEDVAGSLDTGLVIGADTIVVLGEEVLGKPRDPDEARKMLAKLSGATHTVYTGVAVVDAQEGRSEVEVVSTRVTFRKLTPGEIRAYVASGEPLDKAGAYGIQHLGALLVSHIDGDYFAVVGLPLSAVDRLLRRFGFAILREEKD